MVRNTINFFIKYTMIELNYLVGLYSQDESASLSPLMSVVKRWF